MRSIEKTFELLSSILMPEEERRIVWNAFLSRISITMDEPDMREWSGGMEIMWFFLIEDSPLLPFPSESK